MTKRQFVFNRLSLRKLDSGSTSETAAQTIRSLQKLEDRLGVRNYLGSDLGPYGTVFRIFVDRFDDLTLVVIH